MSLERFQAMLEVLKRVSVQTIDIIGGEPTMHRDIIGFIRESVRAGFEINVSSNGTDLTVLEEIVGMGSRVTVGISVNDRETLKRVKRFVQAQKPMVKSVFSGHEDPGMINDILALKPKRFYLIYRDALHHDELRDTVPFHEFAAAVEKHFTNEQVGTVFCSGFLPDIESCPELAFVRCPAGTTKLGVLPDGSVYPCNLFFGKKEFFLGNLLSDPFEDIWEHERLSFFRSPVKNPCAQTSCSLHRRCHGGCPAHGLFLTNDLAAPDPRCSQIRLCLLARQ
jgi:radical SAM protein with 4Fe4S-binding SPASM domain